MRDNQVQKLLSLIDGKVTWGILAIHQVKQDNNIKLLFNKW